MALLLVLDSYDRPPAIADLVKDIAVSEHDMPFEQISHEEVEQIYISLHHIHLPKLEDDNILTYDQNRKIAALTPRGERLTASLDRIDDRVPKYLIKNNGYARSDESRK